MNFAPSVANFYFCVGAVMSFTIKAKLTLTFAILTLMFLAMGGLSIREMQILVDRNEKIAHEDFQALRDVDELAIIQERIQNVVRDFVIVDDQQMHKEIEKHLLALEHEEEALIEKAYSHATSMERKVLDKFVALRIELEKVNAKAIELYKNGQGQRAAQVLVAEGGLYDDQILTLIHDFLKKKRVL